MAPAAALPVPFNGTGSAAAGALIKVIKGNQEGRREWH